MSTADPQHCHTRGCEELEGHAGPHVQYLGSFTAMNPVSGLSTLTVTRTWLSKQDKHIELSVGGDHPATLMLTRTTEQRLGKLLTGELRR